jgi:DNA glycosylase AlkZ-like
MLLRRSRSSALETIEHLIGLQAQAPIPPYFGLWSRLRGFRPDELADLLTSRRAVRIAMMRGTVHLVSADDCLALRPWVQPCLDRALRTTFGSALQGLDLSAVAAAARELLGERSRPVGELGELLHERWPEGEPSVLVNAARHLLPLVQVPPRGIWGASGQTTYTTAEAWLGRGLVPEPSPSSIVRRYLAAFGPATVKDIQAWSGLTGLRKVTDELRPELLTFRDSKGDELLDVPEAPRPGPGTRAPVRLIAPYDNLLLGHADRTRVISDEHRKAIATKNAVMPGTILVDGFVRGTWKTETERSTATLSIRALAPLSARDRAELAEEGARLLDFAAGECTVRDVKFAD